MSGRRLRTNIPHLLSLALAPGCTEQGPVVHRTPLDEARTPSSPHPANRMTVAAEPTVEIRPSRRRRILKIVLWVVGLALFWFVLQLLGVDVKGWLDQLWDQIKAIPKGYLVAALIVQTGQTFF